MAAVTRPIQHLYDTDDPAAEWRCLRCGTLVITEPLWSRDIAGRDHVIGYAPASRYWSVIGVFCGAVCSATWHMEQGK